jgi:hypothetical protein
MPTQTGELGVTFPDNTLQTTAAIAGTAGFGGFHNITLFTATSFWLCPTGVYKIMVTVVGGGGGGWGGSAPNPTNGGPGGVAIGIYTVVPGTTYNVTIGSGGTGVSGGNGGTSSFGAFCSATGGRGGTNSGSGAAGNGSGGNRRNTYVHGGVTGIMSGSDFKEVSSPATPWSINSPFSPGAGTGTEDGGVGGAIMLEY